MSSDPIDVLKRRVLLHQLAAWLPAALHRSRRACFTQAYARSDGGTADAALRAVAGFADQLRSRRLTLMVLAGETDDLTTRLGAAEALLPREVAVHLLSADPGRLPVALKAASVAGAPLLTYLDATGGQAPHPSAVAALGVGRPAEALIAVDTDTSTGSAPGTTNREALEVAGFSLVSEVELVAQDVPAQRILFGTGSEKSLTGFKDALWAAAAATGVRYRDPGVQVLVGGDDADLQPLQQELLAEVLRRESATVTELRRFTLTATPYRAADALASLTALIAHGQLTRDPAEGRLAGDVIIRPNVSSSSA